MAKKYIAEFIGTFALAFIVLIAASATSGLPIAVPLIAGLTLMLFVYTIGPISGCHINPSVTLGQLSVKKISVTHAAGYIVAQMAAGAGAILVARFFSIGSLLPAAPFSITPFLAEMLGAFFFNFGIAAVVYGKAKEQMSGLVVGGSLLFGVLIAGLSGASGILNPAVAFTLNSFSIVYILAPIVGAVLGFQVYRLIGSNK
jgi:aquaporin Z